MRLEQRAARRKRLKVGLAREVVVVGVHAARRGARAVERLLRLRLLLALPLLLLLRLLLLVPLLLRRLLLGLLLLAGAGAGAGAGGRRELGGRGARVGERLRQLRDELTGRQRAKTEGRGEERGRRG